MRIAVTGIGAVTALGADAASTFAALCAGRSGLAPHPDGEGRGPLGAVSGAPTTSELALRAAREALAGFEDRDGLAVVGATTAADMALAEPAWRRRAREGRVDDAEHFVWSQLLDRPARRVARALGARGPRLSASTACTSGTVAVGLARDLLLAGRARAALAFGADARCATTVHGFGSLGLVDPDGARPFSEDRRGLSIGEGAGALLLEPLDAALARGARPLALLDGYGNAADAWRLTAPDPEGRQAERALRAALGDRDPATVGYVNAHGTGTPLNDAVEAKLLGRLFPRARVSGIKGALGHTLGAAGAVEAVVTVLAVAEGRVPPHVGAARPMPGVNLATRVEDVDLEAAVSLNLAFGGHNAAILVSRWR